MLGRHLKPIQDAYGVDLTIVNGENAAAGFGITPKIADELLDQGVDVLTSGNHIWDRKEILPYLDTQRRLLRPANYPPDTPGHGSMVVESRGGTAVAVINIQGRVFMPAIDDPFRTVDAELARLPPGVRIIVVDMHAEATSEKIAMGWYLDGRVSAVVGTHTHIPTADETILPMGTAYITDVGMTGPFESVIGMMKEQALRRFLTQISQAFEPATEDAQFNAVVVDIDPETGKARSVERISRS